MSQNLKLIIGYDNHGVLYDAGESVLRKIDSQYWVKTKKIYDTYKKFNLSKLGIVETQFDELLDKNVLKHKKYITTYPYEWTANMFKDAVLFYLNLFIELDKFNLTLKDAIPSNIVFDFNEPVFVDFLSIVSPDKLIDETWLFDGKYKNANDKRFIVFEKMFFSFILIPFILMSRREYSFARNMLCNKACNVKNCILPAWKDLREKRGKNKFISNLLENLKLFYFTKYSKKTDFKNFCKKLIVFLDFLDVTPFKSDYDSYYLSKREDFSFQDYSNWKSKQKNVYSVFKKFKPKTVLDLGANTGWFSILAAREGAKVIATDIDESSIDLLYRYSKEKNLKILSLFLPFQDLEKSVYGIICSEPEYEDRNFEKNPLFFPPTDRLKVDLVLCLALVHHLILGEGKGIEEIMKILSKLTSKILVLEYISLEDTMIKKEPSFFKSLEKYNCINYNLDSFAKEGKKYFREVEILDSHPHTRKLLIFEK